MYPSKTKLLFNKKTQCEKKMTQTICKEVGFAIQIENQQSEVHHDVEKIISKAVDRSFSWFGETFKDIVYAELEKKYEIRKQDIPNRIDDFACAIEEICGVGAKLIETKIIQAVHEEIKEYIYIPRGEDLVFTEYVESLRNLL